jgi:predicted Zn-dependent protease
MDIGVVAYQFGSGQVYHFVTITRGGSGFGPFEEMIGSVRRLSLQQAAAIRPRIIQVVTVGPNDSVQSLARRMAYSSFQVERFVALNGLGANASVQRGQRVKLIVYGNRG